MPADVQLKGLVLGGAVVAELASEGSLVTMDQHVAVPFQFIFEFPFADVAVVEELPLSFSSEQSQLVEGLLHLFVQQVVRLFDVFDEILDVGVLLLAEAAVLFDLLVNSLDVDLEVTFAKAAERTVVTAELLPRVLPHVHAEVGLDGAGVVAERALVRLFIGVDS